MQHRQSKQTSQISIVGVDEDLRERLEAAAKRAVRSLSGEVISGSSAPSNPRKTRAHKRFRPVAVRRAERIPRARGPTTHSSKGEGKDDRRMRNIIAVRDSAGNVPFSIAPSLPPSTTGGER